MTKPKVGSASRPGRAYLPAAGNGKFAVLAYIRPMNRPLPLIAGLLGVFFLAIAAMYWFVPAGGLPSFFPGFKAGSAHIAVKHAIGSLIIALVLFALAWLQSRRRAPGCSDLASQETSLPWRSPTLHRRRSFPAKPSPGPARPSTEEHGMVRPSSPLDGTM